MEMEELLKAKQIVEKYHQEHVFDFFEEMEAEDKEKLITQILSIDFETLEGLYEKTKIKENKIEDEITPIAYMDKQKISIEDKEKYEKIGIQEIKEGKLAAVTMAGGQRNKTWSSRTKRKFCFGYPK